MKNITVAVSDSVYRDARVWAAKRDTSISATVQYLLENLSTLPRAIRALKDADQAACAAPPSSQPPPRIPAVKL